MAGTTGAKGGWVGLKVLRGGRWVEPAGCGRGQSAGGGASQEGQAGLNFADEAEAAAFEERVQERLRRRQQRAGE